MSSPPKKRLLGRRWSLVNLKSLPAISGPPDFSCAVYRHIPLLGQLCTSDPLYYLSGMRAPTAGGVPVQGLTGTWPSSTETRLLLNAAPGVSPFQPKTPVNTLSMQLLQSTSIAAEKDDRIFCYSLCDGNHCTAPSNPDVFLSRRLVVQGLS